MEQLLTPQSKNVYKTHTKELANVNFNEISYTSRTGRGAGMPSSGGANDYTSLNSLFRQIRMRAKDPFFVYNIPT